MLFVLELISALFLLAGSFLCISGGVGILRFPDFYTRMHAVGVTDSLALGLVIIGLMLQSPATIVTIKLIMILLLGLLISPAASHALAKAALHSGVQPLVSQKESEKEGPGHRTSS